MKKLLQINPVLRVSTSTGRIMQEIGETAMRNGWESYLAYSKGRDGMKASPSKTIPVGGKLSVVWHGIETRLFDRHGLASADATRDLVGQTKTLHPDIIHIHNIHGYFLNYKILFDYLSRCDIPVVWTVHDCWLYTGHCYYYSYVGCDKWQKGCNHCPQKRSFPASLFYDRSARNYADKKAAFTSMPKDRLTIVPVSQWIKNEMQKSFFQGYKFQVIHNGIDTDIFKPYDPQITKAWYGLTGKHILLGVASIWSKEKGLDDFVRMSRLLNDNEIIVLVGIKSKDKKRLPPHIVGFEKTENVRQLAELYSAADAFINPTWQDNYPTVNLEAIACGTPVVTYHTGGSVEVITDRTGTVIKQGDIQGLLNAARAIIQHGKSYYQTACRQYALEHFNKEDRYADYIRLYNKLVKRF